MIVGAVSSICTALLLGYFAKKINDKKTSTIFTIIVVSVSIVLANYFFNNLIDNSSLIRRFIDPNNFVEGYWYESSSLDSNAIKKHATLIKIEYKQGNIVLAGETFDTIARSYANFKSSTSAYNDGDLFFQYTSFNQTHGIGQGFEQFQFNNPPNGYKGFVFSSTSKKYFATEGIRVPDDQLKLFNNFESEGDRKKFILKLIDSLAKR